jgi:LysM repeat protein
VLATALVGVALFAGAFSERPVLASTSRVAVGQTSEINATVIKNISLSAVGNVVPASPIAALTSCNTIYVVRAGDWLSKISASYGLSWQSVANANGLSNPNLIYPGQRLRMCGSSGAAANGTKTTTTFTGVSSYTASGEPCQSNVFTTGSVGQWVVPPGCYGGIYRINPASYGSISGFGWCSWWAKALHPGNPNILSSGRYSQPRAGAVIVFAPREQGAGSAGHYGQVVAVLGNGWLLISEMNNTWRGAGFGKVNYRYVRVTSGTSFIYA